MNRQYRLRSRGLLPTTLAVFLLSSPLPGVFAQAQSPDQPQPPSADRSRAIPKADAPAERSDDAILLSPFQVSVDRDTGYLATSTLAGTRLRSDLKDLAASISVVTKDFMTDVNATNLSSLLVYTLGTEVGGAGGNFSGTDDYAGNNSEAMADATPSTRVRGLSRADLTRDYFLTDIRMDSYNIDRVEVSRGPNSMLFGLGSPAGIVNSGLIKANAQHDLTEVVGQVDSYGGARTTFDHNQVLIKDRLALRVAGMYEDARYKIEEAFERKKGLYLTGIYRPFKHTVIRASTEYGRGDSNRPDQRPPTDALSQWWNLGKPVYNPVTATGRLLGTPAEGYPNPFRANGTIASTNYITTGLANTRNNIPALVYSDPNSSEMGIPGTPYDGLKPHGNGFYSNAAGTNVVTGGMAQLQLLSTYLRNVAKVSEPGRLGYNETQVTDTSIFDYYHHMLHGPNKYEWSEWKTYNVTLEQTFLNEKAGIELVFDKQFLDFGHLNPLDYRIYIDINEYLPNGEPNPNLGRPFTAGASGFMRRTAKDREAKRATGYYELDLREAGPYWLGRILGHHVMNANYMEQRVETDMRQGMPMGTDLDYNASEGQPVSTVSSTGRAFYRIHYLGDSMLGTSSPAGANVSPINAVQFPWNDLSATLLYTARPPAGQTTPNPFEAKDFAIVTNPREDVVGTSRSSYLVRNATEIHSTAATVQSFWLDGYVVTTAGWRKDDVETFDAGAAVQDPATGIGIDDWDTFYPKPATEISEKSRSFGVVAHAPDFITRRLPFGTKLSAFYNDASNFRVAGQRYDINGRPLGSEIGDTEEYGFRLNTFHGKLDLKVAHFKTVASNATIGSFLGSINDIADTIGNTVSQNAAGVNAGNPAGIAAFEQWLQSPFAQNYLKTFNYELAPSATPSAENGSFASATWARRSGQIVGTSALTSTGIEVEAVFNPTRNWRIAANVGRAEAIRTNVAPEFQAFVDQMSGYLMQANGDPTPMGALVSRLDNGQTWAGRHVATVINRSLPTFLQAGSPTSELRKWRWNAVTNYSFREGFFKGSNVGGAVRWQDEGAIGFPYITQNGQNFPDVHHPYRSPALTNFDLWVGYHRKLTKDIDWKIQLNVRNVGVGNELIPIKAQPDGSISSWWIRDPQRITLTNTFTF